MLGNGVLAVRLGGIYTLQRLAEEHPRQYRVQIMKLFCAFAWNPTESNESEHGQHAEEAPPHTARSLREDVQAVVMAIGNRSSQNVDLETQARLLFDMRGSDLRSALLVDMSLTTPRWQVSTILPMSEILNMHTDLSHAKLCSARLAFAKLTKADLTDSCLCGTRSGHADLSEANLAGANLHGALWSGPIHIWSQVVNSWHWASKEHKAI